MLVLAAQSAAQSTDSLTRSLALDDWVGRWRILDSLRTAPGGLATPKAATALPALLARENEYVATLHLKDTTGMSGIYGEAYHEYLGELVTACESHCDRRNPVAIRAITIASGVRTDSLGYRLVREHGDTVLSIALDLLRTGVPMVRDEAISMLRVVAVHSPIVGVRDRDLIRAAIGRATGDPSIAVRLSAIEALDTLQRPRK